MNRILKFQDFINTNATFESVEHINEGLAIYNPKETFSWNVNNIFYDKVLKRVAGSSRNLNTNIKGVYDTNIPLKTVFNLIWNQVEKFTNIDSSTFPKNILDSEKESFTNYQNIIRTYNGKIKILNTENSKDSKVISSLLKKGELSKKIEGFDSLTNNIKMIILELENRGNFIGKLKEEYSQNYSNIVKDVKITGDMISFYEETPGFKESKSKKSDLVSQNLLWYIIYDVCESVYNTFIDGISNEMVNIIEAISQPTTLTTTTAATSNTATATATAKPIRKRVAPEPQQPTDFSEIDKLSGL